MTAQQNAGTPPDARADRAPLHGGRRRPAGRGRHPGYLLRQSPHPVRFDFGAPRATAVLAVLGYRIVNYWLPLPPGGIAYLRLRLRSGADGKRKGKGKPAAPQAG
jgi:hypothetical protein